PGYAIVNISLKPPGGIPGDVTSDQLDAIADLAETYSLAELRVTHAQNLVFPHVRQDALPALWSALKDLGLATPNLDQVGDII
ncbi:nitrite/sulfite reductase, partial [Acinetobacter baumannii]